jgi:hypothetical protein
MWVLFSSQTSITGIESIPTPEWESLQFNVKIAFSSLLHACLGYLLFAFICLLSCYYAHWDPQSDNVIKSVLTYYPASYVSTIFLAIILIELPLPPLAASFLLLIIFSICLRKVGKQILILLKGTLLPFAAGLPFAMVISAYYHGPTAYLGGSTEGDLIWYAANSKVMAEGVYPLTNLGVLGDTWITYINKTPSIISGALGNYLPHYDYFLFLTASCSTIFILFASLIARYVSTVDNDKSMPGAILPLSIVGSLYFPAWIAVSATVPFALPAIASSFLWYQRASNSSSFFSLLVYGIIALVVSVLSKVVGALSFAALALNQFFKITGRKGIIVLVSLCTITAVAGFFIFTTDVILVANLIGRFSNQPYSLDFYPRRSDWRLFLPILSYDMGALLFVVNFINKKNWAYMPLLLIPIGLFFWVPSVFHWTLSATILLVMLLVAGKKLTPTSKRLYIASLLLLTIGSTFHRFDVAASGLTLIWGLGIITWLSRNENRPQISNQTLIRYFYTPLIVFCATTILVTAGILHVNSNSNNPENFITTDFFDVWENVEANVPPKALIFTPTDSTLSHTKGWNTVSYFGNKQVYLSAAFLSYLKRPDMQKELTQRLDANAKVLAGETAPEKLKLVQQYDYSEFYAVLPKEEVPGRNFKSVYENTHYGIYKIETDPSTNN